VAAAVTSFIIVRKDSYQDSVLLMRISQELKRLDGIADAVVAMATPNNRDLLRQNGFVGPALDAAGANDLLIAVKGDSADAAAIEAAVDRLLRPDPSAPEEEARPTTLLAAVRANPDANMVLISVPGEYAAAEARRALLLDKHVMLFSSNVSTEDEVALKKEAVSRGLLCMGPDCGTAIINGKPLAFANVVRRGVIGVVGAAGTGIQEVTSLIHRLGGGISQAIGVGGRDLTDAVGGAMTLLGIEALAGDPGTQVIVVISKPPSPLVSRKIVEALAASSKPCVVHFVGAQVAGEDADPSVEQAVFFADSLAGAAKAAFRLATHGNLRQKSDAHSVNAPLDPSLQLAAGTRLCALFCGGTLGHEALAILTRAGLDVRSNLHKTGPLRITGAEPGAGHVLLDLGDEIFTQGRPHPMIEPALRNDRLAVEIAAAPAGLLLFDVVLGYGSHADPAGLLVLGIEQARAAARGVGHARPASRAHGTPLVAIASVTGTPDDPQDYRAQVRRLEDAGVIVAPDNRTAAEWTAALLQKAGRKGDPDALR
jgi:FdrA protein